MEVRWQEVQVTSPASCSKLASDDWSRSVARLFVTTHPWESALSEAGIPGIPGSGTWAPRPAAAPAPLLAGAGG